MTSFCEGGGVSLLSVSDDGMGMAEEDARLCVERHATSKLEKLTDLNRLATFGFRGEALPSIASVSRFTLRTRARDAEVGLAVVIEGGSEPKVTREGMKIGTTIELRDLFFNVPARRKFLRSTGTESAHVTSALEGAALARPDVTFTLTRDGRKVRELLRVTSRRERVLDLLSEETLVEIRGERGPLRLEAHLSSPERGRPGAAGLSIVVNGRIVKDRMLSATVAQAYGAALSSGNYPRGVVYLDLPPELVDVNVHPQKTEVRFVDPRALSDALYSILSRELAVAFALPQANRGARYRPDTKAAQGSSIGVLPVERPFAPNRDLKSRSRELALREATNPGAQSPLAMTQGARVVQPPSAARAPSTAHSSAAAYSPSAALDFTAHVIGASNTGAISQSSPHRCSRGRVVAARGRRHGSDEPGGAKPRISSRSLAPGSETIDREPRCRR
ncbi:MAG: DNA mismatch repair endonuclease MutL [Polyangiaceae bacterium]